MNAVADVMHVRQATLDNGLTVYLSENHERPRIAARVVVRAGAAEDPADRTGIAHYLEHMLANKGSQRLGTTSYAEEAPLLERIKQLYDALSHVSDPQQARAIYEQIDAVGMEASQYAIPNELKQLYGLLGARKLNAFTSQDQTAYVVDIPANRLVQWAHLEGDRFRHPVFRSFQTEVETVFEEKNRSLDDSGRRVGAALQRALWGAHPYSREVLGARDHLRRPSISQMEAFFSTWYVPNNMAVVLAGDFDSDEALRLIEAHFGGLVSRPLPPRQRPPLLPIPQGGTSITVPLLGVEEIRLAWRTVPFSHPARSAGALADMLLDNRATGLLDRNLIIPQRVRAAGSYPGFMRDAGTQVLWGRPLDGQSLDEVENLLLQQVAHLQAGDFTETDLEAILLDYEQTYQKGLEENGARAGLMMRSFLHEQPWRGAFAEVDSLRAVTPEQIVSFAQEWMTGGRASVRRIVGEPVRLPPLAPPISSRSVSTTANSDFFRSVLATPAAPIPLKPVVEGEDYQRREASPALVLFSAPNPFNDLCQLTLRIPQGRHNDPSWSIAASLWRRAGTPTLELTDLNARLYQMGASLGLSTGKRMSAIKLVGPDETFTDVLSLLKERVCTPRLPADEARRLLADAVSQRHQIREERRVLESALREWLLEGEDSIYLGGSLSDDDLRSFDVVGELGRLAELWASPWEALYAGPRSPEAVLPLLERPAGIPAPAPLPSQGYRSHAQSHIWLAHHPSVQATVMVLCPWETYSAADAHLYHLYSEYMGGNAGLVFQEIREARGMAYAAQAGWRLGWQRGDANLLWGSVGTQADKAASVAALLEGMLRNLPLQPARFARAQASAIERLRTGRFGFRELPGVASGWSRRGHTGDPRPKRLARLAALTLDDLQGFARAFSQAPMQICIVGDTDRIDRAALSRIAPVCDVSPESLFID